MQAIKKSIHETNDHVLEIIKADIENINKIFFTDNAELFNDTDDFILYRVHAVALSHEIIKKLRKARLSIFSVYVLIKIDGSSTNMQIKLSRRRSN